MKQRFQGGCHCGDVRFEVELETPLRALACDCSRCRRRAFLHLIVPRSALTLHSGREALVEYRFNTRVARHLFCGRCGVESFYVPRSNPDGYSVNLRCLDDVDPADVEIAGFRGSAWEEHAAELAHLSREG